MAILLFLIFHEMEVTVIFEAPSNLIQVQYNLFELLFQIDLQNKAALSL